MKSTIKALAELILQNVDVLDASINASGGKEPTLDEPYNPETGYPFHDPEVIKASDVIGAAAMQLLQTVRPPQMCLISESVMVSIAKLSREEYANYLKLACHTSCNAYSL